MRLPYPHRRRPVAYADHLDRYLDESGSLGRAAGPQHPLITVEYCRMRAALDAALVSESGRPHALPLASQVVDWCREHLPPGHPELAAVLVSQALAATYASVSPEVAEPHDLYSPALFREAMRMRRAESGPVSQPVLATLEELIFCQSALEQWAVAASLMRRKIRLLDRLYGSDSVEMASAERQLGDALQWSREYDEAEAHYRRALRIFRRNPLHPAAALAWTGLAILFEGRGDPRRARKACTKAMVTIRALFGEVTPQYALCLVQLGRIASGEGQAEEAARSLGDALAIQRAYLGDAHPNTAATWADLSLALIAGGQPEGLAVSRGAIGADSAWLNAGGAAQLDTGATREMLATLISRAERHLRLLLDSDLPEPDLPREAAATAAWRSRLPDLLLPFPWLATSPGFAELARERRAVAADLATAQQHGTTYGWAGADINTPFLAFVGAAHRMRELRRRRRGIDAAFRSRMVQALGSYGLPSEQPGALQEALTDGECFVQILRVAEQYHAILVGRCDEPISTVDLGAAAAIDAAVWAVRTDLQAQQDSPVPWRALSRLVLDPLLPFVDGRAHVIVALDGSLLHIPFGALPVEDEGEPWFLRTLISYANGMDDVPRRKALPPAPTGPDVIIAAPNYDLGTADPQAGPGRFLAIPATATEGAIVARTMEGARLYQGDEAVKSRVCALRSPRILHVATHGYNFFDTVPEPIEELSPPFPGMRAPTRVSMLLREYESMSGLALAGANTWLRHDDPGPLAGTGLLTIADVAGLDLAGTDLVVLSACDTGVGGLATPEAPANLRAAFMRAGARTVVASLWRTPDTSTRKLIIRYYTLLMEGAGKAAALRLAQLDRYQAGAPVRAWGAFVCYGDVDPLRKPARPGKAAR